MKLNTILICSFIILAGFIAQLLIIDTMIKKHLPPVATVNIGALTQAYTLEMAKSDYSEDEITLHTQEWAKALVTELEHIAAEYDVVIIPSELGVYGAVRHDASLRERGLRKLSRRLRMRSFL